jgi:hypothetical protein
VILTRAVRMAFSGPEERQAMFLRRPAVRAFLALLCGGILVAALLSPWWEVNIQGGGEGESLTVYPYKLDGARLLESVLASGFYSGPVARSRQMVLHTAALSSGAALCVVAAILRGRKRGVVLGAAGVLVLADVYAFVQRITGICAANFDVPPQGKTELWLPIATYHLTTRYRPGLYLAIAGGGLALLVAIVLGIVRER